MKTKPKNAKPVAYCPKYADSVRQLSYDHASATGGNGFLATLFAKAADKEDAKEPEAWRYAGAGKLGVEGI